MVLSAVQCMDHPWRVAADTWLVESLVYEDVLSTNKRGLVVPSDDMARWYQRKWSWRPISVATNTQLDRMRTDPAYARLWAGRFRKRWNLVWAKMRDSRTLRPEEISDRVAIYLRWLQWTLQRQPVGAPVVIVAMDETSMSSVHATGQGAMLHSSAQHAMQQPVQPPQKNLGRLALLASVCSDPDIQKHLPQIWLPRTKEGQRPPAAVVNAFTAAGYPHEGWHGTRGWTTQSVVRAWFGKVRRKVLQLKPGARIIIVLDVCPTHVAQRVLDAARRLELTIVFVPARCTWLLQILDTHVFAQLKREMRRQLWRDAQRAPTGTLTMAEQLQSMTRAATQVLVNRSWSHLFGRVGLDGRLQLLRPSLRQVLIGKDMSPRRPTMLELADILGAHRTHVGGVAAALFPTDVAGAAPLATSNPSSSSSSSTSAPLEEECALLTPMLQPAPATKKTSAATGDGAAAAPKAMALPRARRLWPCPRNLRVLPDAPVPDENRIATRSQKRPLVPGILDGLKRAKSGSVP